MSSERMLGLLRRIQQYTLQGIVNCSAFLLQNLKEMIKKGGNNYWTMRERFFFRISSVILQSNWAYWVKICLVINTAACRSELILGDKFAQALVNSERNEVEAKSCSRMSWVYMSEIWARRSRCFFFPVEHRTQPALNQSICGLFCWLTIILKLCPFEDNFFLRWRHHMLIS